MESIGKRGGTEGGEQKDSHGDAESRRKDGEIGKRVWAMDWIPLETRRIQDIGDRLRVGYGDAGELGDSGYGDGLGLKNRQWSGVCIRRVVAPRNSWFDVPITIRRHDPA